MPKPIRITLPADIVAAIDRYNAAGAFTSKNDPSKLGALNAVAYIGEQVAALVQARQAKIMASRKASLPSSSFVLEHDEIINEEERS